MKGKILTWNDFRAVCKMDAKSWAESGWKSTELSMKDILSEYPKDYFEEYSGHECNGMYLFTPEDFAAKTLAYLEELEKE